jgi:TatD DNase family protein
VPYRGKRNEPAFIAMTARKLAEVYNVSVETIAEKTSRNAMKIFSISLLDS